MNFQFGNIIFLCFVGFSLVGSALAAEPKVVTLWPGKPPGETKELPPEENLTKPEDKPVGDRQIIKLTNVSFPTLSIYRPAEGMANGTAVIICPGGGHRILAFDHEGTEVAEFLTKLGVTGIVLKYRVPFRNPEKRWEAAVQDGQRAVSFVRSHAQEWGLNPEKIGIMGFSAGGETAALTAILEARQYEPADEIDQVSSRPDFAALIYTGGLATRESPWEMPDYVNVTEKTPPMFLVHAFDDNVPVSNSLILVEKLKKANVAAELHVYATGGHGYGMRKTGHPVNSWPDRYAEWLKSQGWLGER